MTEGVRTVRSGTLVERVLAHLQAGPADSLTIARDVLGLHRATPAVAERVAVALLGVDPRIHQLHDGRWALAVEDGTAPRLEETSFAVVDVETTGTSPRQGDRVTEIAVVALDRGRSEVVFESLVNPERPIPPFVSQLTRITDEMVRDQPTFGEIADDVLSALAGRVFVAHNVRFDWGFVAAEVRRARDLALEGPRLCTVQLSRRLIPGLRHRNLDAVTEYFGIQNDDRHRARGDALATAIVLQRLLDLASERGAVTVDDLHALGRRARSSRSSLPTPMAEA